MRRLCAGVVGVLAGLFSASPLSGAIVSMQSGERLIGEISPKSDATRLVLESPLLGEITLPREQIVSIQRDVPADEIAASEPGEPASAEAVESADAKPATILSEGADEVPFLAKLLAYKAPEDWKGNLRLGLNLSTGDTKWTETFMQANLVVDPSQSPNYYRYVGSYTLRETEKNDGTTVVSTDRYDANFTYRRDISEAWFLQNSIGGRVDRIKGIDRELQELIGLGFRLNPTEKVEFLIGGGGGVEDFQTQNIDTRTGFNPVANFFQELTWRPFEKASLVQEFNYFVNPDVADQFNYVLRAAFRYRITDLLGIEFSFDKNFDNDVGNGNAQDDTRLRNAVIVYF